MPFPPPDPARDAGPEPAPPDAPSTTRAAVRPGDLAGSWRAMLGLAWLAAFFAYAAVWQASVQIGIGTWWLGPRAQPTHVAIKLIPFYLTLVIGLLVVYNVKWIVRWSALGIVAATLIALPDFSRSVGLGVAEATIAGLLGVITLASLSGRYRIAPRTSPGPTRPDPAAR